MIQWLEGVISGFNDLLLVPLTARHLKSELIKSQVRLISDVVPLTEFIFLLLLMKSNSVAADDLTCGGCVGGYD